MATNIFKGTKEPASPADIQAIEEQYGFTLPEDYKAHILRYNGGFPERSTFVQQDAEEGEIEREIDQFKSVRYGTTTLERSLQSLRSELHDDLIPFANEAGGDQFVLSVGPEDYGSVYYISHESYVPPEYEYDEETDISTPPPPRQYGEGVYFLASSFTAFLEGLIKGPPVV